MFNEFSLSVFHKFRFQLFGVVNFLKQIRYMLHRIYLDICSYLFEPLKVKVLLRIIK